MSTISEQLREYLDEPLEAIKTPIIHEQVLNKFYEIMYPYIPYKSGAMSHEIWIDNNGIHFETPYANRNYHGEDFNFSKEVHPLAQANWAKVALDLHGDLLNETSVRLILK